MPDPMLKLAEPGLDSVIGLLRMIDPIVLTSLPAILSLVRVHAMLTEQEPAEVLDQAIGLALHFGKEEA